MMCVAIKRADVFRLITTLISSNNRNESPRSSRLERYLIYQHTQGIKIDRYCHRGNAWTEVAELGQQIGWFAVIHRNGQIILIGGLRTCNERVFYQPLNSVSNPHKFLGSYK